MDFKLVILLIEIIIVTENMASTLDKKRKKTNSAPHVDHVSKAKAGSVSRNLNANSITDQNKIKIPTTITNKPKRTISEIRQLIKKKKLIENDKRRKKVLKRLRKQLAKLKRKLRSHLKKCKTQSDCGSNECCIKKFTLKGIGRCRKRPKIKQRCRPALLPGLDMECPCRLGLTCAPFKLSKKGFFKFRCETLPEEEHEQQSITGLGRY